MQRRLCFQQCDAHVRVRKKPLEKPLLHPISGTSNFFGTSKFLPTRRFVMNVIAFQPWNLVNRLHRDLERSFAHGLRADAAQPDWVPAVDVRETDKAYVLTADLPGVNPQDIEVTAEKGELLLKGTRAATAADENGYSRIERLSGRFERRFTLPESADAEAIEAKSAHGVLTLTIPKRAQLQPRKIAVQAA
jgi:HSP20 family protein